MKKDQVLTVRINSEILEALKKKGWTPQKLIDDAVSRLVKVKTTIQVRGK